MNSPSPLAGEGLGRGVFSPPDQKLIRSHAKRMRQAPTDAEHRLWQILHAKRLSGFKFRRQVPIDPFIADFVCLQHRLIVEADGGQHSEDADAQRTAYLKAQGFRILRFWNNDIFNNEEGVTAAILAALDPLSPTPLPQGERGSMESLNG